MSQIYPEPWSTLNLMWTSCRTVMSSQPALPSQRADASPGCGARISDLLLCLSSAFPPVKGSVALLSRVGSILILNIWAVRYLKEYYILPYLVMHKILKYIHIYTSDKVKVGVFFWVMKSMIHNWFFKNLIWHISRMNLSCVFILLTKLFFQHRKIRYSQMYFFHSL